MSQVNEEHRYVSICTGLADWNGDLMKEWWHLPVLSSLERVAMAHASPAITLKSVHFVAPCMSLALFELLPLHWSSEKENLCADLARFWGPVSWKTIFPWMTGGSGVERRQEVELRQ